ncbi:rRNA pseudouridine synthase [Candidatus Phytoplasma ziziphi]|uniref:Pseudouridine synthase n=2 Tax=Candidatus Phytoplasma TaxID=33926 RepID=A0A660HMB0_ZIZJU|nr:pseudouridine synthase [Candidatus Phytoplasma ziziphi]AYJ01164.1 rRNA pseudouridine synthase [Candidatus Phytoplasma ziziphi]
MEKFQRLQKILSQANISSRRDAEKMILSGKIKVNGKIISKLGVKVSTSDIILVDGRKIFLSPLVYFLLYKPKGYLTTVRDDRQRKTVLNLLKSQDLNNRVYPVGRLDFLTEGLLLLTNDGPLTHKLTHPTSLIPKEYHVKVNQNLSSRDLIFLKKGVLIDDNYLAIPKLVAWLKPSYHKEKNLWLKIIITEGKNRQIRKMISALGLKVIKLIRYRYSFLTLEKIKLGEYRVLKQKEINQLKSLE